MNASLPLPTLLSQVLIAFTIEFDNEFERQTPHRTSKYGPSAIGTGPWLVSMAMWANFMRFVPEEGVTVGALQRQTHLTNQGIRHWVTRMSAWWGYIVVAPNPTDSRPQPPYRDWVVHPTAGGRKAIEVWRPLCGSIQQRWCERFGAHAISQLRESLWTLIHQFDSDLPEYMPVLGHGLIANHLDQGKRGTGSAENGVPLPLTALLSQALLAFTIDFERASGLSLAVSANILRILRAEGRPERDLPRLSGVSKEGVHMCMGVLKERGYIVVESDATVRRIKMIRLTSAGVQAQDTYRQLLLLLENRWQERYGEDPMRHLHEALESLVGIPTAQMSPLLRGLEPYPNGWRARVGKPETLPHYPMVLHRGGFPDGS